MATVPLPENSQQQYHSRINTVTASPEDRQPQYHNRTNPNNITVEDRWQEYHGSTRSNRNTAGGVAVIIPGEERWRRRQQQHNTTKSHHKKGRTDTNIAVRGQANVSHSSKDSCPYNTTPMTAMPAMSQRFMKHDLPYLKFGFLMTLLSLLMPVS